MTNKEKPCNCGRHISGKVFPHRRETKCEEYESSGDDIEKELEDDRFNAEFRRVFT